VEKNQNGLIFRGGQSKNLSVCCMHMVRTRLLMICCLVLGWHGWTHAGPLRPLGIHELIEASDLVLRGKVTAKKVARDEAGRIFTTVCLEVMEVWKGQLEESTFELVQSGGILGNQRAETPFQASFRLNQEAVVFCRLNPDGKGVTIGLTQGKFDVFEVGKNQPSHVRNLFLGGPPPTHPTFASRVRMPQQLPMTLEELKQTVREETR